MTNPSVHENIETLRAELGKDLAIIGHHYQVDEVIRHTDHRGDSLALSQMVSKLEAKHVVFCGVYFMAESAALLAREDQKVYLPDPSAECVMATMSPPEQVREVIVRLQSTGKKVVPITYVNSTLGVKAVVGEFGGSVCTSSKDKKILTWALEQGDIVLFVPDRNLGANTAKKLGVPDDKVHVLSTKNGAESIDLETALASRIVLWPGFCPIHTRFATRQIERLREEYPGITIAVHPECTPEVTQDADANGSTSFLIQVAEDAPQGAAVGIGTEVNLVQRLAKQYEGHKTIIPLVESECTHMTQTTAEKLLATLKDIQAGGTKYEAKAASNLAANAKKSLETMLQICL